MQLIVGANGLLGRALGEGLLKRGILFRETARQALQGQITLDLANDPSSWQLSTQFDVAYLLAATTETASCEADPGETHRVNVVNTIRLAQRLVAGGSHICYVSTNLVLAGDRPRAPASSPLVPQCTYAVQKAEVERALLAPAINASVVRVTKVAEGLIGLVTSWAHALVAGQTIAPFSDLVAAPMPSATLIEALIRLGIGRHGGLHQIGADEDVRYDEMALILAARLRVDPTLVRPIKSATAGVRLVTRPVHTTLETAPTERLLGLPPISSRAALVSLIDAIIADLKHPVTRSDRSPVR